MTGPLALLSCQSESHLKGFSGPAWRVQNRGGEGGERVRGQTGFFSHLTLILSVFVPLDQRSASMRSKGRRLEVRDCSHLFSRPATHAQTRDLNLQNSSSSVRIKNLRMVSIDTIPCFPFLFYLSSRGLNSSSWWRVLSQSCQTFEVAAVAWTSRLVNLVFSG